MPLAELRQSIRSATHADETELVAKLLVESPLDDQQRTAVVARARALVTACRADKKAQGTLDAFLQEFGLSNQEGVALMCLAEALLRVPDAETADRLIAEKVRSGNWSSHSGKSESLFVNASTWGLMLTGKLIDLDPEITGETHSWMKRLTNRVSEPVVRKAVYQAMKIMGGQYVLGSDIAEGLRRGAKENLPGTRFSFDMLGESARTEPQASKYFDDYSSAISAIGAATATAGKKSKATLDVYSANGISVKLSALHPRYHYAHAKQVMAQLLPRIKTLCVQAKSFNMGLSIDAEEAERLDLSLDIFEALARDPELAGWDGLGFVLQAYQKRAPLVAQWLIALAHSAGRRLMVRLVKGAYWDAEIKHAQEQGYADYPVYTRKANTDLCYHHCAAILLSDQQAIYPQFATHNAHTAALVLALAGDKSFEFQRLHGMGHILYKQLRLQMPEQKLPIRVYAPIGVHKDLLPYLVRRLLENGANSSFVNRFLDDKTPVEKLISDNIDEVTAHGSLRHSRIAIPRQIFRASGEQRDNARGIDLDNPDAASATLATMAGVGREPLAAAPLVNGNSQGGVSVAIRNPANTQQVVGEVMEASGDAVDSALASAHAAQPEWNSLGGAKRAEIVRRMGDLLEEHTEYLMGVITKEAGRTIGDALSEVREAVDFCRYYALNGAQLFESNGGLQGAGVFVCISPWNFPLAIFTGQIAAALVAGNSVLAKPAEQTPLIAYAAVQLFHRAGVPGNVLHLLPGSGARIGGQLLSDLRVSGLAFTGSTRTAQRINRQLASRRGPVANLIAETGGQNCMIVDSTALPEQVVDDVIGSAFQSAGQRCSALRVLFLQQEIADKVLTLLRDAMATLHIGDPAKLSTDIGPVIDKTALDRLAEHSELLRNQGRLLAEAVVSSELDNGWFCPPQVFEIDSLYQLKEEVFAPILHVIRYRVDDLPRVLNQINDSGYGLTMGVHSRIENFARYLFRNTRAGNNYINRNMVGAVVGVNPFGGCGLSGTGPKAGGPNYLYRFTGLTHQLSPSVAEVEVPEATPLPVASSLAGVPNSAVKQALKAHGVLVRLGYPARIQQLQKAAGQLLFDHPFVAAITAACAVLEPRMQHPHPLPGPTGEQNLLSYSPRGPFLMIADGDNSNATAIALSIAAGCPLLVVIDHPDSAATDNLKTLETALLNTTLPDTALQVVAFDQLAILLEEPSIQGVICQSDRLLHAVHVALAGRDGAILPLLQIPRGEVTADQLWRCALPLVMERTWTDNLIARGGNTQLFNLTE